MERQLPGGRPFDTVSTKKRIRLFSAVQRLPLDPDGRVLLPAELLAHAGITTHAAFVGMGHEFQIWDPATFEADGDAEEGQSAAPGGDQ